MSDFMKSDYCTECDGEGKVFIGFKVGFDPKRMGQFDIDEFEQCQSCEELHRTEVRADRMMDEMKGS